MGGIMTTSFASSSNFKKILTKITFGGEEVGKNNSTVLYRDRRTGGLLEEKIPAYIRLGIMLLYQEAGSNAVELKAIKRLLRNQSKSYLTQLLDKEQSSIRHLASITYSHSSSTTE
jgi:phosphatidylserine decarboxylase